MTSGSNLHTSAIGSSGVRRRRAEGAASGSGAAEAAPWPDEGGSERSARRRDDLEGRDTFQTRARHPRGSNEARQRAATHCRCSREAPPCAPVPDCRRGSNAARRAGTRVSGPGGDPGEPRYAEACAFYVLLCSFETTPMKMQRNKTSWSSTPQHQCASGSASCSSKRRQRWEISRTDLNDSPAEARHVGQLLERLGVWVVVLGELGLHDLRVVTALVKSARIWVVGAEEQTQQPVPDLELLRREGGPGPFGRFGLAVLFRGNGPL